MLQKKNLKNECKFYCEKCDYSTAKKSLWVRHLDTKKHKTEKCYIDATKKVPIFFKKHVF